MNIDNKKGFTLLELLIVIAILASLATIVVVVLNPAETMKKARDVQRISDLATLKTSIGLYLEATTTGLTTASETSEAGTQAVDGTGWLPLNFGIIAGGSPISNLPLDPTNNATYYYTYDATSTSDTFELTATLESDYYKTTADYDGKDGGNDANAYEVGTDLTVK